MNTVSVLKEADFARQRRERVRIGCHEHFALAIADGQRRTLPRADQQIMMPGENHRHRIRAAQTVERGVRGLGGFHALFQVKCHQMRDDDRQMRELFAYHNFTDYVTQPTIDLANEIASHAPDPASKVFFTSGGSDAVDSAGKLVRRYHQLTGSPERTVFIAREWAYHGMHTYGTSLAGIEPNRSGYGDLVPDVVLVPHDDTEAIEKAIDHAGPERIAGIYCEPVIGAGGVRPVPVDYLHTARDLVRGRGRALHLRRGHHRLWSDR